MGKFHHATAGVAIVIIGLCACQCEITFGQTESTKKSAREDVKVKHDSFTGERTITLEPTAILDLERQRLSLSAEIKLGGNGPKQGTADMDERVTLKFTSLSPAGVFFGENQLHFLVDGTQVRGGFPGGSRPFHNNHHVLKVGERIFVVLPLSRLRQIARGSDVQMRLGPVELTLDDRVLGVLREFVAACGHQNNERESR